MCKIRCCFLLSSYSVRTLTPPQFNLGWKLANVALGLSSPDLLSSYTEERLPVIAEMLNKTTELHTKAFKSDNLDDKSHWHRKKSLDQLGVNYRWSSIVLEETTKGTDESLGVYGNESEEVVPLAAGDRAPDAPGLLKKDEVNASQTLFDTFKYTAHTVLIFCPTADGPKVDGIVRFISGLPQRVRSVILYPGSDSQIEGSGADIVLRDQNGHGFKGYGAPMDRVHCVVVRPDGMVGAIVAGVSGLTKYFDTIFSVRV